MGLRAKLALHSYDHVAGRSGAPAPLWACLCLGVDWYNASLPVPIHEFDIMTTFSTPRGTKDILPDEWPYWNYVLGHAHEVAELYGYRRIETPTFGQTQIFTRTTGTGTDIVDKEMYTFRDGDGEELSLRPEGTAPVIRAYLQHGMFKLPQPVKLYYLERIYRYDRPQQGRFREHHQFGCEAIGVEDAYMDVELISLLDQFYRGLDLCDLSLHLNSIGDKECRPAYVRDLVAYLRQHEDRLSETDRARIERNPLRVLDSKEEVSKAVLKNAPDILDYLCEPCREHWNKLRHGLDILGIQYEVDPCLVRGLDYYNRTVFEFMPGSDGAQSVVGGGGRYDPLAEAMGGPHVPGVGFGSGIERLILNVKERGIDVPGPARPAAYIAHMGDGTADAALRLAQRLRKAGVPVDMAVGSRKLGAQLKYASAVRARFAAIIGEDELREDLVTLRDMDSGEQRTIPTDDVLETVAGPPH